MSDPIITDPELEDTDSNSAKRTKTDDSNGKTHQMEESKLEVEHFFKQLKKGVENKEKVDEELKPKILELL